MTAMGVLRCEHSSHFVGQILEQGPGIQQPGQFVGAGRILDVLEAQRVFDHHADFGADVLQNSAMIQSECVGLKLIERQDADHLLAANQRHGDRRTQRSHFGRIVQVTGSRRPDCR